MSIIGMLTLTAINLIMTPPEALPYIFTMALSVYSCIHFVGFLVVFHLFQFGTPSPAGSGDSATVGFTGKKLESDPLADCPVMLSSPSVHRRPGNKNSKSKTIKNH